MALRITTARFVNRFSPPVRTEYVTAWEKDRSLPTEAQARQLAALFSISTKSFPFIKIARDPSVLAWSGAALRAKRRALGWTMENLAARLPNCPNPRIVRSWEQGAALPTPSQVSAMEALLGKARRGSRPRTAKRPDDIASALRARIPELRVALGVTTTIGVAKALGIPKKTLWGGTTESLPAHAKFLIVDYLGLGWDRETVLAVLPEMARQKVLRLTKKSGRLGTGRAE
jgi:ribosome-binding protein aMBF1 (putative translation factor)